MTDVSGAIAALKTRSRMITSVPVFWTKENNVLPDPPKPFVFFELEVERQRIVSVGGGRGANLYRCPCELLGWLAVGRGRGAEYGAGLAESIAAVFRSFRDGDVSCGAATPRPVTGVTETAAGSMRASAGNYDWYLITVRLHFDQIG